jgi:hypothetical protein
MNAGGGAAGDRPIERNLDRLEGVSVGIHRPLRAEPLAFRLDLRPRATPTDHGGGRDDQTAHPRMRLHRYRKRNTIKIE